MVVEIIMGLDNLATQCYVQRVVCRLLVRTAGSMHSLDICLVAMDNVAKGGVGGLRADLWAEK